MAAPSVLLALLLPLLLGAATSSDWLDSVYWQTRLQAEFYQKMRRLGIFVNAPDVYFQ